MNAYARQVTGAYRTAASAVSPLTAVVRLTDEAQLAVRRSLRAREEGDFERAVVECDRAVQILGALRATLDPVAAPAMAADLERTYTSLIRALQRSVTKPDAPARLKRLADAVSSLRDAWVEVARSPR